VRVAVLDLQGREVALLTDGVREAGRHEWSWSGQSGGRLVAPGLYFVRAEVEGGPALVGRLVVARP